MLVNVSCLMESNAWINIFVIILHVGPSLTTSPNTYPQAPGVISSIEPWDSGDPVDLDVVVMNAGMPVHGLIVHSYSARQCGYMAVGQY